MPLNNIDERKLKVNALLAEKSEDWLEQCLDIYKDAIDNASGDIVDEELAELVVRIGDIAYQHCNEQEYEDAEYAYDGAITICRTLTEKNPEYFMLDVATCVKNKALLHEALGRCSEALNGFQECVTIYKELAEKHSIFDVDVAKGLRELAHYYLRQKKFDLLIPTIDEAISYDSNNPLLYESKGLFMLKLGHIDEALDLYDRVWELDHDFFIHYSLELYDGLKEQGLI